MKSKTLLGLAAFASLAGCAAPNTGTTTAEDEAIKINTANKTVWHEMGGPIYAYRVTDFQTGQLCMVFSSLNQADCRDFETLSAQQKQYVEVMRVKLAAASQPARTK